MSHKHLSLLRTLFQDPINTNIHWREVESLLEHLGAAIEPTHGGRFRILLNRQEGFISAPHHNSTCSRDLIKHLREYLGHAGVSLAAYEDGIKQERQE
ncbi:hypothetical protein [Uliginosibacterium gangwonense]|uniref:hypothetical protein n=1 Tax=Uliginosibacterium gangwonense TaxID=392736 RepID=UPI000366899E|nr:hypothetical protein [Uliginosibacterium gangwonense]